MARRSGGTVRPGAERMRSPTVIWPASSARNPARSRNVVVLPQPEGPSSETSCPGSIARLRSSTAATVPKYFVTRSSATADMVPP